VLGEDGTSVGIVAEVGRGEEEGEAVGEVAEVLFG
jgi:hypothetical protein